MIIQCDKCILRNWKASDVESLVKNANNIKIAKNLRDGFPFPYTYEDGQQFLSIAEDNPNFFAITVDDNAVGGIGLSPRDDIERISAEIGYWLGEEYWGKGIVSSAIKGITKYGFNDLNLLRIFATPLEQNIASIRVLEKNGFILEGILRKSVIKCDAIYNTALYAKIKE